MISIIIIVCAILYLLWSILRTDEDLVKNRNPHLGNILLTDKKPDKAMDLIANAFGNINKKLKYSPGNLAILGSMPISIMSFSYVYLIQAGISANSQTEINIFIYYRVEKPLGYISKQHMKRLSGIVEDALK